MPDQWDYLAPGGAGTFGPFTLEQLQFWVVQGHLEAGVQVGMGWWRGHLAAPPGCASSATWRAHTLRGVLLQAARSFSALPCMRRTQMHPAKQRTIPPRPHPPRTQVKLHSAAGGWWDLPTAARCLASGQPLPVSTASAAPFAPAAPGAPAAPPVVQPSALPVGHAQQAQRPPTGASLAGAPLPGPPPVTLSGSGAWAGHATPVQQLASFQQGEAGRGTCLAWVRCRSTVQAALQAARGSLQI